jgi:hypothetical protein
MSYHQKFMKNVVMKESLYNYSQMWFFILWYRLSIIIIDIHRPSKIPSYKELQISFKITLLHKYLIKDTFHTSNSKFFFKFRAWIYISPTLYYVKACGHDTLPKRKTLLHEYMAKYLQTCCNKAVIVQVKVKLIFNCMRCVSVFLSQKQWISPALTTK